MFIQPLEYTIPPLLVLSNTKIQGSDWLITLNAIFSLVKMDKIISRVKKPKGLPARSLGPEGLYT